MDDFLYAPHTPPPDEKRSKYNPFMLALRLDNLPPSVKPGHLTHILSHPPTIHGQAKRRQESGVSLVQVYTVPKQTKSKAPRGLGRMLPFRSARATMPEDKVHTATSSPRQSDDLAQEARPVSTRLLDPPPSLANVSEDLPLGAIGEEAGNGIVAEAPAVEPQSEETYAILHFRDEYWLYRAKHIFRRVTIDGRPIGIRTKRWNGSAVRRLWTKERQPSE